MDPDLETKDSTMESEVKATVRRIFADIIPTPLTSWNFALQVLQYLEFRPFWIPPSRFALKATQSQLFVNFQIFYFRSDLCASQIGREYAALLKWRQAGSLGGS